MSEAEPEDGEGASSSPAPPPADRISIDVRSVRGGMLLFAALSISLDEADMPRPLQVGAARDRSPCPAGPVCVRYARPSQLDAPRFMAKLAEHMAAAPASVHRLTHATRVDIAIHQPGTMRRLFGASTIGGDWLPILREAVECRIREWASA